MHDGDYRAADRWSEAAFRALTENSGDIISLLDDQGRLVFNSSAAERISGFSREELANIDTFSFIHPDDREATRRAFEHVLSAQGNVVTVQYRYRHKSGGWTWMEAVANNRLHDPDVRGVVTVSRDITERKAAEEELRRLVALNQELVAQLRTEAGRKSTFLAELSHELRNPLAAVRSGVEILENMTDVGEEAQHVLAIIERQTGHLVRLMDDLLEVTRIERRKIQFEVAVLDLSEVVQETVDDLRTSLRAHRLFLHLPQGPVLVRGDRVRLAQVLANLLENARKFTPDAGTISVTLRCTEREAILEIADDGEGIDEDSLETIFLPFSQSERTLHRSGAGLGLGLALVKGIVELHGGTARVESEGKSRGSRFQVRLPVAAPEERAPARAGEPVNGAPLTILVIDDNVDVAESMRTLLELIGHSAGAAHTGAEGVSRARALVPDVVLCDIGLPDMDGYAVARALRGDPVTARTKLVALSGYAQEEDQRRATHAGFHLHVAKPVGLKDLKRVIAEMLR